MSSVEMSLLSRHVEYLCYRVFDDPYAPLIKKSLDILSAAHLQKIFEFIA